MNNTVSQINSIKDWLDIDQLIALLYVFKIFI